MAQHTLFADANPRDMERVTTGIGMALAAAAAHTAPAYVLDPSIHPSSMVAGIVRAHLLGAVSAIAASRRGLDPANPLMLDAVTFFTEALRDMKIAAEGARQ